MAHSWLHLGKGSESTEVEGNGKGHNMNLPGNLLLKDIYLKSLNPTYNGAYHWNYCFALYELTTGIFRVTSYYYFFNP